MTQATCPHCAFQGEVEAFFVDAEGKRLAAVVAELPPECGRAVLGYLRLFKPAKTALRTARAVKLAREVADLIKAGTVCKDERGGVRRPASPATWAAGIEHMLAQRDRLSLPLETHGYLRAVVFGLADQTDAAIERQRDADARAGRRPAAAAPKRSDATPSETPLERDLKWIDNLVEFGGMTPAAADEERAKVRAKHGAPA
jgi:hypothetical protein